MCGETRAGLWQRRDHAGRRIRQTNVAEPLGAALESGRGGVLPRLAIVLADESIDAGDSMSPRPLSPVESQSILEGGSL
jgi:hypothetical protein